MPARTCLLAISTMLLATPVFGQWSDTANLAVGDKSGEQVQPKIAATDDGGSYISWFDNNAGGYDVYLQRLDAGGNEQWAHNGVLIADRSFSSTQDYDLAIDAAGNALLIYRSSAGQITASKIAPDGTLLWGDGVDLVSGALFIAAPKITATSDGNVTCAWTQDSNVGVMKLDADGTPLWGSTVVISDAGGDNLSPSDVAPGTADSTIIAMVKYGGFSDPRHLLAHKLDADGAPEWKGPVAVFDGGSLQFGNFPGFVSDGSGGVVFTWYSSSPSLQCYVQRILGDGSEVFPHNGVAGSSDGTNNRVSPDVYFDQATENCYMFWTELNSSQSERGVYGQRIDAGGVVQWGATGVELLALEASERSFVRAAALDVGIAVAVIDSPSFGNDVVRAARVNTDGTTAWTRVFTDISFNPDQIGRLQMAAVDSDEVVLTWHHGGSGSRDILAQNLNADGSLGQSATCDADISGDDNTVDVGDLLALLIAWGTDGAGAALAAPFDVVDTNDLLAMLIAWGDCE